MYTPFCLEVCQPVFPVSGLEGGDKDACYDSASEFRNPAFQRRGPGPEDRRPTPGPPVAPCGPSASLPFLWDEVSGDEAGAPLSPPVLAAAVPSPPSPVLGRTVHAMESVSQMHGAPQGEPFCFICFVLFCFNLLGRENPNQAVCVSVCSCFLLI